MIVGARRVALDLGAQLADEHAQILRVVLVRRAPDGGEDLAVGHHPAGVGASAHSRSYSRGVSLIGGAVARDQALVHVDDEAIDLDARLDRRAALGVAQRGAQPRQQFADGERLFDVIVGAEVERRDLFRLAVARRKDEDRRLRRTGAPGRARPCRPCRAGRGRG